MKKTKYIVKNANWECCVNLEDTHGILDTEQKRVLEASTQAFELLYKDINHDIEIISILNENGDNYVDDIESYDDGYTFPYVLITMITTCYKKSDEKKPEKHYYILSEYLVKNSGTTFLLEPLQTVIKESYKRYPELKKFISHTFKDTYIVTNQK